MKRFLEFWAKYFGAKQKKEASPAEKRLRLEDVECGDEIYVEFSRMTPRIGLLLVAGNDPETRKMAMQVTWTEFNGRKGVKELVVFDYDGKELANFHLLNSSRKQTDEQGDDTDIASLQKSMNKALEEEDYLKADEIQKKIDKLLKN